MYFKLQVANGNCHLRVRNGKINRFVFRWSGRSSRGWKLSMGILEGWVEVAGGRRKEAYQMAKCTLNSVDLTAAKR